MNHSMLNTAKAVLLEENPPGEWNAPYIVPNMQIIEFFWLTTYIPTVILQEFFFEFDQPYAGINHSEDELIAAVSGDWAGNGIFAPAEPGGRDPTVPVRGRTLTGGVEVYGFYQLQLLHHPEFRLGGQPVIPMYLAYIQGDGGSLRTTPATFYTPPGLLLPQLAHGVIIPESAYTQAMQDDDNRIRGLGSGGTEWLTGKIAGLYHLFPPGP